MPLFFKQFSLPEVKYLLIRFAKNKSFLGKTWKTNNYGVNKQRPHRET